MAARRRAVYTSIRRVASGRRVVVMPYQPSNMTLELQVLTLGVWQ